MIISHGATIICPWLEEGWHCRGTVTFADQNSFLDTTDVRVSRSLTTATLGELQMPTNEPLIILLPIAGSRWSNRIICYCAPVDEREKAELSQRGIFFYPESNLAYMEATPSVVNELQPDLGREQMSTMILAPKLTTKLTTAWVPFGSEQQALQALLDEEEETFSIALTEHGSGSSSTTLLIRSAGDFWYRPGKSATGVIRDRRSMRRP